MLRQNRARTGQLLGLLELLEELRVNAGLSGVAATFA
jgi:hypothetical protein